MIKIFFPSGVVNIKKGEKYRFEIIYSQIINDIFMIKMVSIFKTVTFFQKYLVSPLDRNYKMILMFQYNDKSYNEAYTTP